MSGTVPRENDPKVSMLLPPLISSKKVSHPSFYNVFDKALKITKNFILYLEFVEEGLFKQSDFICR